MIQECCVGYTCRTGWKMTISPSSIRDEFVVGVSININKYIDRCFALDLMNTANYVNIGILSL